MYLFIILLTYYLARNDFAHCRTVEFNVKLIVLIYLSYLFY